VANALDCMSADAPALSPDDLATAWGPELDPRRGELKRGEVGEGARPIAITQAAGRLYGSRIAGFAAGRKRGAPAPQRRGGADRGTSSSQ
jgi:hypothetical protein